MYKRQDVVPIFDKSWKLSRYLRRLFVAGGCLAGKLLPFLVEGFTEGGPQEAIFRVALEIFDET